MSARRVAWTIWVVAVLFAIAGLALLVASFDAPVPDSWGFRGFTSIFALTFSTVGALIVGARRSTVGWLLLAAGLLSGIQCFAEEYAIYGVLARPGSLPAPEILGWVNSWIWVLVVGLVGIYVPLLFPNGRFLSRGWQAVGIATALAVTFLGVALALTEGPLNNAPFVDNPFGVPGFRAFDARSGDPGPVFILGYNALIVCVLAGIGSVVARFRAARGIERQQMKWFAFGGGILVIGFLSGGGLQQQGKIGQYFMIGALQIVPIAVAVAVLRYRLYDVDLLINRTLVYGAVSGTLVASYFAVVVLLQTILRPFTSGNELAVAGSTLLVVALFQPLRRRVQDAVDRRFYRSRYDAARTLDAFGARLRDEVDLDSVRADLLHVVHDTVRPAHASVWLRPSGGEEPRSRRPDPVC